MNGKFSELFPELLQEARDLNDVCVLVAMVVIFAGLILSAWRGAFGDLSETMRAVAGVAVLAIAIRFFPDWVDEIQRAAAGLVDHLGADPSRSHQEFARIVTGATDDRDLDLWDVLWAEEGGVGKAFIYAIVLLVGRLAWIIVWLAWLLQHIILVFAIALSPVFLAMFSINATRGIAVSFVMSFLGVLLWPLGWSIAGIMTDALLRLAAANRIHVVDEPYIPTLGTQTLSFLLVLSLWMLVTTERRWLNAMANRSECQTCEIEIKEKASVLHGAWDSVSVFCVHPIQFYGN